MRNIKATKIALALIICGGIFFAFNTVGADERNHASNRFHITVMDVVGSNDLVVKTIRIDSKSDCHAKIMSDKKGGGGLSASAGSIGSRPEQGVITVTVLADHVEWQAGDVDALKFRMSIQGNGSKALMSDTGPMATGKQLNDLLAVSVKTGTYAYDTAVPILKFKDRTFSLTVTARTSKL